MHSRIIQSLRRAAGVWFAILEFAFSPHAVCSFLLIALVTSLAMATIDWYRSGDERCADLAVVTLRVAR